MNYLWALLLSFSRAIYFIYSTCSVVFPVALLYGLWDLRAVSPPIMFVVCVGGFFGLMAVIFVNVYLEAKGDMAVFQKTFLTWFGTLRTYSSSTPFGGLSLPSIHLVENPPAYRIRGNDVRKVQSLIKPGDLLLRGYDGYVDGLFIRHASVCEEKDFSLGWFTHAAIYVGDILETDHAHVPLPFRDNTDFFQPGESTVIHSMAKGVFTQDLESFCRCDYLTVLRLNLEDLDVDPALVKDTAKIRALSKIGSSYDFDASDVTTFTRFSCSELVYYCLYQVHDYLNIFPRKHALYPLSWWTKKVSLLARVTIVPDDFYNVRHSGKMAIVWEDPISTQRRVGSTQ